MVSTLTSSRARGLREAGAVFQRPVARLQARMFQQHAGGQQVVGRAVHRHRVAPLVEAGAQDGVGRLPAEVGLVGARVVGPVGHTGDGRPQPVLLRGIGGRPGVQALLEPRRQAHVGVLVRLPGGPLRAGAQAVEAPQFLDVVQFEPCTRRPGRCVPGGPPPQPSRQRQRLGLQACTRCRKACHCGSTRSGRYCAETVAPAARSACRRGSASGPIRPCSTCASCCGA